MIKVDEFFFDSCFGSLTVQINGQTDSRETHQQTQSDREKQNRHTEDDRQIRTRA